MLSVIAGNADTATTSGERRAVVQAMKRKVLAKLYSYKPETRQQIGKAVGYGVFSDARSRHLPVKIGIGHGILTDNDHHNDTYMKMDDSKSAGAEAGEFRIVMVFHTRDALAQFLTRGRVPKMVDERGDGETVRDVSIYRVYDSGVDVPPAMGETQFWQDAELNQG